MNSSPSTADSPAIASPPQPAKPPRKRQARRWFAILAILASVTALLASPLTETSSQRELGKALYHISSLLSGEAGPALTSNLEVLKADGLPKELVNQKAEIAFAAPDRLWVSATVGKEHLELARNRQEIWIWQPAKNFAVVGAAGIARFASAPDTSRDTTQLGPMALPVDRRLLAVLPRLFSVETRADEDVNGERCHVLQATPISLAVRLLHLPSDHLTLTLWIRQSDGWPVRIGYADGKSLNVELALNGLHVGDAVPEGHWQLPAPADAKIEHVALSHLLHFFENVPKLARTEVKPLGPAHGERHVLATHGKGRLENRDDSLVLFLRGTPEEMGDQHGTLLRPQVRDLVHRVLYGVGVGSSFAKGRWFFGEIEECQARIAPFINPRSLREMDALARASGLESEEVRLGNFFPELFHCSGFALMGGATGDGHIYHGRILDYMKGVGLEADAVVMVNQPDQGHAWVNIGYAGFVGTVTAMNDQHISIGEMGGRGEGHWDGKPMAQLLREVMENAGTLDEAVDILRRGPRTCEYYYVIADGKTHTAVGVAATTDRLEVVHPGEAHPRLPTPVQDTILVSANDRYKELVRRVQAGYGTFNADTARDLMTRPVCMASNIHSVLFAPDTLDFWVANADSKNVASHNRYTQYNLSELLKPTPEASTQAK